MATLNQLHRRGPEVSAFEARAQRRAATAEGRGLRLYPQAKEAQLSQPQCCSVRLSTGREAVCFIPEGPQPAGAPRGRTGLAYARTYPNVKLKVVRGKYDCGPCRRRSDWGTGGWIITQENFFPWCTCSALQEASPALEVAGLGSKPRPVDP